MVHLSWSIVSHRWMEHGSWCALVVSSSIFIVVIMSREKNMSVHVVSFTRTTRLFRHSKHFKCFTSESWVIFLKVIPFPILKIIIINATFLYFVSIIWSFLVMYDVFFIFEFKLLMGLHNLESIRTWANLPCVMCIFTTLTQH